MLQSIIEALQANVVLVGLLVGAVTPPIVSIIQQPKWSRNVRIAVSVAVSVVVGFAVAAADGQLDPANLISVVMAVAASAEAFYQKVWKASGVAGAVERATSPAPAPDFDLVEYLDDPYGYYEPDEEPEDLETK